jgi:hypothetical protein
MAIPASGPLALTDIQTEFGGANPIGLNEYYAGGSYVPAGTSGTYGAVPSSGAISIQNFYGTSNGAVYWVISSIINANSGNSVACNSGVDSSGNVYLVGMPDTQSSLNNNTGFYIIKTKQVALSIASSTIVSDGYKNGEGARVAIDSSNNVYVAYNGPVTVSSVATYGIGLAKYNSSGTLQWSRTVGSSTTATPYAPVLGVVIDSAGYIYVAGLLEDSVQCVEVTKYDSSGTFQWGKKITAPSGNTVSFNGSITDFNARLSIDSSNNIYIGTEFYRSSNSVSNPLAIVLDSSGSLISGKTIYGNGNYTGFQNFGGVTFDSSGYVWFLSSVANASNTSSANLMLKKLSNANPPVLQLVRGVLSTVTNRTWFATGVARDSSDNIYVVGTFFNESTNLPVGNIIIKYNNSGTVQWQRQFSKSGTSVALNNIIIDSSSTFIVSGFSYDKYALSIRLPIDGSRTGTYGSFTYAASTYTTGSYSDVGVNSPTPVSANFPSTIQSITTSVTPNTSLTFTTTITAT